MLVQQARIGERWIACDCLADGEAQPILTPAFLSEADTFYLRRLTSPKRPEHRTDCPFFREQATNRLSEVRTQDSPADPPIRSEEHTSELQSLMRSSYAVFCLKKKQKT